MSIESVLETKHAMKRYTPEALGQGKARSGGVAARKLRYEVVDRLSHLGSGLTAAQKTTGLGFERCGVRKCVMRVRRIGEENSAVGCRTF